MAIKLRGSRRHPDATPADFILDNIATGLATYEAKKKTSKYFTHLRLPSTIGDIIRDCNGSMNMHANGKGRGCLYREVGLPAFREKAGEPEVCDHAVPITDLAKLYLEEGERLEHLIFSPVVRLTKVSDTKLHAAGYGKKGAKKGFPLYRYALIGLNIVAHNGQVVDPETWTEKQHWDLIWNTEELMPILEALRIKRE